MPKPVKVTDVLTREQIKQLLTPTNHEGFQSLLTTWGLIAFAFVLAAVFPNPLTIVFALIILGGQHLALAILMHESGHRSLFRTPGLNDFFGHWFCAAPTWNKLAEYRKHHQTHHAFTNTEKDVDLGLVTPFPVSRLSMMRKLARDLIGVTAVKRIVAQLAMDFGLITYTASHGAKRIDQTNRSFWDVLALGAKNLFPVVLTNAVLFGILALAGEPLLYLLWVAAYMTTYSLFLRIRAIAEHACTDMDPNPLRNTRTTRAGWLSRFTVAPHHVNYHLEHHLLPTVPHYRLAAMHRMLRENGALEQAHIADGYGQVLKLAAGA
ncbi:MAG: fatty acid desaturase family protein [Acidobacteriota bacterium]|nr:fatty acid desaturase family protein [Acidobacteriota bacterium]